MEFHDDVLVLNSSASPTSADFFQLKTLADKMWKLKPLLAIAKAKAKAAKKEVAKATAADESAIARSILGKLVDHSCRFGSQHVRTMNIVSNAKFDLDVASPPQCHEREQTCLSELSKESLTEIRAKLKGELGLQDEPPLDNVYLIASGISLTDHATHGAGALAEFLERRNPGGWFAVHPLYRALSDELTRRATHEWQPTSFIDLCKRKGIDRATLESFLDAAEKPFDRQAQLPDVLEELARENVPYRDRLSIERGWRRYQVERMDESNSPVQGLRNELLPILNLAIGSAGWSTLIDLVQIVRKAYGATASQQFFETSYVEGAILFELKAIQGGSVQAPSPKSEKGKP
jgi:hypothetical protein